MKRLLIHRPDIVIFSGEDELFTYGLLAGAHGGIGMNYNAFPDLFVGIYNCVKEGRIDDAMKLQNALAEFLDPVFKAGLMDAGQYAIQLRFGEDMRCFREPGCIRDLNDDEKAAVKETFENLDRVIAEVLG
jgi:N-acetylneuraminate lyase